MRFFDYTSHINDFQARLEGLSNIFYGSQLLFIYTFMILAVLQRSVQKVCGTHLRVFVPGWHSFFQRTIAMESRWKRCVRLVYTGQTFNRRPPDLIKPGPAPRRHFETVPPPKKKSLLYPQARVNFCTRTKVPANFCPKTAHHTRFPIKQQDRWSEHASSRLTVP